MLSISSLFQQSHAQEHDIIIYSDFVNNRLIYTLDFIIKQVWKKNYLITHDKENFIQSDKLKINYSENHFNKSIHVYPLQLLKHKGIEKNFIPKFEINTATHYKEDIFSKVFYFISRYEEWQKNYKKDSHNRFEKSSSVFNNQLNKAIVDESILAFKEYIQKIFSSFSTDYLYKEILTFDLDNILAFKGKKTIRNTAAILKHLIKFETHLFNKRIKVLLQKDLDPFEEVYPFIQGISPYQPIIFFILCRSDTTYDRAAHINHYPTKNILNNLKQFAPIGLHPSYYSIDNFSIIQKEKQLLEHAIQEKIIASRQHYLRSDITITPKLLIQAGIKYDFTMGFASDTGFRAGTSYPFYYYDFENEKSENLLQIPFCIMDGAYFNYQKIPIETAIKNIQSIKKNIQNTGGYFIPLFHEITLSPLFNSSAHQWKEFLKNNH